MNKYMLCGYIDTMKLVHLKCLDEVIWIINAIRLNDGFNQ